MTRKRLAGILLAVAAAAALYLALPRPNQLVPYTTPPLNSRGDRVSLLVPRGWRAFPAQQGLGALAPPDSGYLGLLNRLRLGHREEYQLLGYSWISANEVRGFLRQSPAVERQELLGSDGSSSWRLLVLVVGSSNQGGVVINYERSNKAAFDATHVAIFRSARIIPGMARGAAR